MKYVFLGLLLLPSFAYSQFKIGDISVSDSVGNKFLRWCYNHPDTIEMRDSYNYLCTNCTVSTTQQTQALVVAMEFNTNLINNSIKRLSISGYSSEVGTMYEYAVPKKPTEILFIKWLKNSNHD